MTIDRTRPDVGDGRNLDQSLAEVSAEGAQQRAPERPPSEGGVDYTVWSGSADPSDTTYYDRPTIKKPVWIWAVPAYMVVGGAAGGAAALGAAARAIDGDQLSGLIKRCRVISAMGLGIGGILLVYDLGRPGRFLNMLRVFRPTSPLNVGSWLLAAATPAAAVAACSNGTIADLAGMWSGAMGLPITGYPGVLLANTAVPVWEEMGSALPASFVASGAVSAASALELMELREREASVVRAFAVAAKVSEAITTAVVEKRARRVREVGKALDAPRPKALLKAARAAAMTAALLSLTSRRSGTVRRLAGIAGTIGAAAYKFGVFYAGDPSATDPRATFALQRQGRRTR
ncbi:MAG: polysulfide reductase NrfD [Actinomycetota bacterium]|nr:polysulfide reductase NrfD [Actinomycetota bacterium]